MQTLCGPDLVKHLLKHILRGYAELDAALLTDALCIFWLPERLALLVL